MSKFQAALATGTAGLVALWCGPLTAAPVQQEPAASALSFTPADAAAGALVYAANCAACHGAKLGGGTGQALAGKLFLARWAGGKRTYASLYQAIRRMPKQAPESLSAAEYANVTAFVLARNGFGAGKVAATRLAGLQAKIRAPGAGTAHKPAAHGPSVALPAAPAAVALSAGSAPTDAELAAPGAGDWLMYNRTYSGDRNSPLAQITATNAHQLQPVCMMQLGVTGSFQSSPIVYKGAGYVSTTYGVFAFDPATCQRRWNYTHVASGEEGFRTNRGMTIYDGKLFRGTSDAHLLAIDAQTGKLLWDVHVADASAGYSIGAAPVVYKGKVIVGLAGGDNGTPGHVYAFDAKTGALAWTFDTIDKKSWTAGAELGGGATWTTVAVDPVEGTVFVPVGNPAPDFNPEGRPGDNLYTNSVVALDAATGKVRWHVQQIAADIHDWDTAAAPILYEQDGRRFMAVGNKAGHLFIYDRDTHALVSRTAVVEHKNADVVFGATPVHVCPSPMAGVEWNGPAYDPRSRAIFVNSIQACATFAVKRTGYQRGSLYLEGEIKLDPISQSTGWTRALDAATGRAMWTRAMPAAMVGGVTPTAGGVVLTGGADGNFLVLDQATGTTLYSFNTGGEISGGVATYEVGGKQYVAVASGGPGVMPFGVGGTPTLVVFALP